MQELPDMKYERCMRKEKEPSQQKKESCSFSTVTVELKTPISFLLLVESHVSVFLCGTLVNLSTGSSRLCYQQPTTKNTK